MMRCTSATAVRRTSVACAAGEPGATSCSGVQARLTTTSPTRLRIASSAWATRLMLLNQIAGNLWHAHKNAHLGAPDERQGWMKGASATQSRTILPRHAAGFLSPQCPMRRLLTPSLAQAPSSPSLNLSCKTVRVNCFGPLQTSHNAPPACRKFWIRAAHAPLLERAHERAPLKERPIVRLVTRADHLQTTRS